MNATLGRLGTHARTPGLIAGAATALVVLATALSAWSWPGSKAVEGARRLAAETHGSLSETALKAMTASMDRSTVAIARRQDPQVRQQPWGLTPGWSNLSLSGRPDLGFDATAPDEAQRLNAAIPGFAGAVNGATPFVLAASSVERARAVQCLSDAIYYEAALEPREGQEAVAQVVLNRVRDPNFPNSVCGVVFQGSTNGGGCQFSFTCDGSMQRAPVAWAWKQAQDVSERALNGYVAASVGTSTHYHADYVMPYWSPTLLKLKQIGRHIFYRWRGGAGEAKSFVQRYAGSEPYIDENRFKVARISSTPAKALAAVKAANTITTAEDGSKRVSVTIGGPMAGRRKPSKDEIAKINASLAVFDKPAAPAEASAPVAAASTLTK
jgi:spore germination cell wall hydrolase CwlJ-like protein